MAKNDAKEAVKNSPLMKFMKGSGWLAIIESVIMLALGVLLIINAEGMLQVIFTIVGLLLGVNGVYKMVSYFATQGSANFQNNDLLYGVLMLVFGVLAIVMWRQWSELIGIVVGAWLLYSAVMRMNTAIRLRAAGVQAWAVALVFALILLGLGIYMVVNVHAIIALAGWILVTAAIMRLVDDIIFMMNLNVLQGTVAEHVDKIWGVMAPKNGAEVVEGEEVKEG